MKVRILHSYVNDLSEQNRILVHTVEELEKEANEKVAVLKVKLQASEKGINVRRVHLWHCITALCVNVLPGSDTCRLKEWKAMH